MCLGNFQCLCKIVNVSPRGHVCMCVCLCGEAIHACVYVCVRVHLDLHVCGRVVMHVCEGSACIYVLWYECVCERLLYLRCLRRSNLIAE